jgi:hypothetical protein
VEGNTKRYIGNRVIGKGKTIMNKDNVYMLHSTFWKQYDVFLVNKERVLFFKFEDKKDFPCINDNVISIIEARDRWGVCTRTDKWRRVNDLPEDLWSKVVKLQEIWRWRYL